MSQALRGGIAAGAWLSNYDAPAGPLRLTRTCQSVVGR
jgi:hypothetical protein